MNLHAVVKLKEMKAVRPDHVFTERSGTAFAEMSTRATDGIYRRIIDSFHQYKFRRYQDDEDVRCALSRHTSDTVDRTTSVPTALDNSTIGCATVHFIAQLEGNRAVQTTRYRRRYSRGGDVGVESGSRTDGRSFR
jgi:hypothetical protein